MNRRYNMEKKNKMHKVFSRCSFYNKKKKGDSWSGSETREIAEVLRNPICVDELVSDKILRDFRRHFIYPAIAILLMTIVVTFYLCYIGS